MQWLIKEYGNEFIYLNYGIGMFGGMLICFWLLGKMLIVCLMNCCGGYFNYYGDYLLVQIVVGLNYIYGGWVDGNSLLDIENSQLVVLFGNNFGEMWMSGGGVMYYFEQVWQKFNVWMIIIDLCYIDIGVGCEDEWILICSGIDVVLVLGFVWVMIIENLVDQFFFDKYCVGYDEKMLFVGVLVNGYYKVYIFGQGIDGIVKMLEWVLIIIGILCECIVKLVCEIVIVKLVYISQGWGLQCYVNGEIVICVILMFVILMGNVGINGGNSGVCEGLYSLFFECMLMLENLVEISILMFMWIDVIECGLEMIVLCDGVCGKDKFDVLIKMIWNYVGNCLINQYFEINWIYEILQDDKKCEMIVVIDCYMIFLVKYVDILLLDCIVFEQMDFVLDVFCGNMFYVIFVDQVIKLCFECKIIYEMISELVKCLGVEEQFIEGCIQEGWMCYLYEQLCKVIFDLLDFDIFCQQGIYKQCDL